MGEGGGTFDGLTLLCAVLYVFLNGHSGLHGPVQMIRLQTLARQRLACS